MKPKAKINLKNILAYIQGKVRYSFYYNRDLQFLLQDHIKEQISVRINSMDAQCFYDGQCRLCGCQTTALQMANKSCDKPCYPRMMSKRDWRNFKKGILPLPEEKTLGFTYSEQTKKFIR